MTHSPLAQPAGSLPLFYQKPEPLHAESHGRWSLREGNLDFAAQAHVVPVMLTEFGPVARSYPLVFAPGDAAPLALLGLEHRNLFVADGQWAEGTYLPAYVRRYPFGFIATTNPDDFILAIDAASERLSQDGEGSPLFVDGKPSELTRQALQFCDAFQSEALNTQAFSAALMAQGLLVDRRADVTLPNGRQWGLKGFQVIDVERLRQLDDAVIVAWHRKGWLELIHFHLASLENFSALLERQGKHDAAATASAGVTA